MEIWNFKLKHKEQEFPVKNWPYCFEVVKGKEEEKFLCAGTSNGDIEVFLWN